MVSTYDPPEAKTALKKDPELPWFDKPVITNDGVDITDGLNKIMATSPLNAYAGILNKKPDGGPSDYYRLDPSWVEVNDIVDHKTIHQWGHQAVHLFNIFKAVWRWGDKDGTTKNYDAKKIIYCGCRVYMMLTSKEDLRKYLQELLDDKQFK